MCEFLSVLKRLAISFSLLVFHFSLAFGQADSSQYRMPDSLRQVLNGDRSETEITKKWQITKSMRKTMDTVFRGVYSFNGGFKCSGDRPCHVLELMLLKGRYVFAYYLLGGRGDSYHLAVFNLVTQKLLYHAYLWNIGSIAELKASSQKPVFTNDNERW